MSADTPQAAETKLIESFDQRQQRRRKEDGKLPEEWAIGGALSALRDRVTTVLTAIVDQAIAGGVCNATEEKTGPTYAPSANTPAHIRRLVAAREALWGAVRENTTGLLDTGTAEVTAALKDSGLPTEKARQIAQRVILPAHLAASSRLTRASYIPGHVEVAA